MFDGLFQSEADAALALEAEAPRPHTPKPPGFFTGMGTALLHGPTQGALESARAGLNVLSEFGKAAAFAQGGAKDETIDRMFTEENPDAAKLGRLAKEYDPTPEASSTAAQVVHGFGRIGAKVAGGVALAGPAAPLVVGADEGITEGLKLADKGVDAATAAKAGAVHGVVTAASVALPIAGKTIGQTVGLAVAGGPASFVAEQATIRKILEDADYSAQAAEYDPFDVTGLVVSTGGPLLFGAATHAARAVKGRGSDATPKVNTPPDDVVDAARVELLNQHDIALVHGEGPAAQIDHVEGREAAAQRIQDGEGVLDSRGTETVPSPVDAAEALGAVGKGVDTTEATIAAPAGQGTAAQAAEAVHPDIAAAQAAIAARGDFEIELEDGSRMSAKQALADADEVIAQAQKESSALSAAAECFLEGGA